MTAMLSITSNSLVRELMYTIRLHTLGLPVSVTVSIPHATRHLMKINLRLMEENNKYLQLSSEVRNIP